jgi:hypothetical protein
MTLQAKLDAFKADFEAGKPPYNVPLSVIETMHRATDELIASGAATRALKAGDNAQPSRSGPGGARRLVHRTAEGRCAGCQLLSRCLVSLLQHGTPGASGSVARIRSRRSQANRDSRRRPRPTAASRCARTA